MSLSRILGGVGRTLIAAGVLLLLFVVYQLWGTGIRTGAAQNALLDDFQSQKAAASHTAATTGPETPAPAPTPLPPSATPPITASSDIPPPQPGQAIGVIRIPKIGAEFTVVEGVDLYNLAKGPGHFPQTPLPGQAGNSAIAGHRVTHSAPFNRIDELVPGDLIEVETVQGPFTYEVLPGGNADPASPYGHRIINPYQTEILDQSEQNILTLMACHPKYDLKERIVTVGRLVQNPAPATPRPPPSDPGSPLPEETAAGDELVGGDSSATGATLLWALVAAAVWLGTWALARRWPDWRQWPRVAVYAGGAAVFAIPLFLAFESLNNLLPAGY